MRAIERQKNVHIEQLMASHEKAFAEIKNYYNDITHNNLDLIKSLKEGGRCPTSRDPGREGDGDGRAL